MFHSDICSFFLFYVITGVSGSEEGGNSPAGKEMQRRLHKNSSDFALQYIERVH